MYFCSAVVYFNYICLQRCALTNLKVKVELKCEFFETFYLNWSINFDIDLTS